VRGSQLVRCGRKIIIWRLAMVSAKKDVDSEVNGKRFKCWVGKLESFHWRREVQRVLVPEAATAWLT
jgi:hypothetical protein